MASGDTPGRSIDYERGRVFGALMRHAWAWWRGQDTDPEDGQHHLASVAWCALVLITYQQRRRGDLDGRPED